MTDDMDGKEIGNVIRIDEARIKDHLGEMVRVRPVKPVFMAATRSVTLLLQRNTKA